MMKMDIQQHGFLPTTDPLLQLNGQFAALEKLAAELPKLLLTTELRHAINHLPEFPLNALNNSASLERAMMLLSFLGHAYVWGVEPVVASIPPSLALPWYEVAKKLNRPPVLSYASYALHNWRRLNPAKPIELGNIVLLQNFLGGVDEEWFVLVHVDIEAKAAPALQAILLAQQAVQQKNTTALIKALIPMAKALTQMCNTLDRMPEKCDPYIYYHRVRPYIHGWKDNPALPQGLTYTGVAAYQNQPQQFRGETGAQSAIIPSLDAALNIQHKDDPLRVYLKEMRDYMPKEQREFIKAVEEGVSVRKYVKENVSKKELRDVYNQCIELVTRFRTTHLHYAASYIHKQAQTSLANPTAVGTGGTPFMEYLRKHKEEAAAHLL